MTEPNFRWNFRDSRTQLLAIVGTAFGEDPATALPKVKEFKRAEAASAAKSLALGAGDIVAEIGSGYGFWAAFTAPRVKQVYCLDISPELLDLCATETRSLPNITPVLIEPSDLSPLRETSVNKVYSAGVFIHFNLFDIAIYLTQLYEILPRDGLVLFNIANSDSRSPLIENELFRFSLETYRADKAALFTNMYWNSPGTVQRLASQLGFEVAPQGTQLEPYEWFLLRKR
jgi:cyclopropane fatty-acyl-phospholipid synthase-like methyltransferase